MRRRVCRVLANGPGRWEVPLFLHVWFYFQAHLCAREVLLPPFCKASASSGARIPFTEFLDVEGTVVLRRILPPAMARSRCPRVTLWLLCAVPILALRPAVRMTRRTALQTAGMATLAASGAPLAQATELDGGMLYVKADQVSKVTTSFQPTFITYLSRFLLNYDQSSADWWRGQLRGVPLSLEREQLRSIRERQFGQFSASVEVGLQKYQGRKGVRSLFSFLNFRYGQTRQAKLL